MKKLFFIIAVLMATNSQAQINRVSLQASGLTCSMCSNAINKSLKSLNNVEKVMSNISTSTFEISFKNSAAVNFDELKKKVEDAGFFVSKLTAVVSFNNVKLLKDEHLSFAGMNLHFLNGKEQVLDGIQQIQVLDKGYVSSKIYKKNSALTQMDCYKTGVAAACCASSGMVVGSRMYHVTLL
ncbi:MAG: heavy-metal-associated domain-containing protein [Ferruginibacter sp.]